MAVGERMYSLRRGLLISEGASPYEQVNVWSDGTWSDRVVGEDTDSLHGVVASPDLFGRGFMFNLMEGRFGSPERLQACVRNGRCTEQSITANVLYYSFEAEGLPSGRQRYELHAELTPKFRVLSFTVEIFRERDAADPTAREVYTVRKWRDADGVLIPAEADVLGWQPARPDLQLEVPTASKCVYRRIDFRPLSPALVDESLFQTPMPIGTKVWDERLNLSYNIGEAFLVVDGVSYELREPLMEPPRDRLSELIQTAVRKQGALAASAVDLSSVDGTASQLSRFSIPMLLGVAFITGIALIVRRNRKAKAAA